MDFSTYPGTHAILETAVLEGTMEDLMQQQPVDTRGERKRSGRPCVGGKGELWDGLLQVFLSESHARTKNGLPGVPYAIRNTIGHLKMVWSEYVPGVATGTAPTDFLWIATAADAVIDRITSDIYATADCSKYLHALADAAAVLSKRSSSAHVTDIQAPQVLYPPELQAKYRAAAVAGCPRSLHPTPCTSFHYVHYMDLLRLQDAVRTMHNTEGLSPETARLVGWGNFVMTLLLPVQDGAAPLHMQMGGDCFLDELRVWKHDAAGMAAEGVPVIKVDRQGDTAMLVKGTFTYELSCVARKALQWVYEQRDGAVHMERLLPRRLTADTVLRRLSKGPLKGLLKGKLLTVKGITTTLTTYMLDDVLTMLDSRLKALQLADVDALDILTHGVYPSTVKGIPALFFPGDEVPASALVVTGGLGNPLA